jgi:hypothetical protein
MPLDLDDNSTSTSSDDVTLDDATTTQTGEGVGLEDVGADGASSSDAHGDNAGQDTLGIVRDVVTGRDPAAASPAEGNEQQETETAEPESGAAEDDEYKDVPFNQHPRFRHLIKTRDALKTERNELREDATRYRNVQQFMDENGIGADESANAFTFMAMVKQGKFVEAWDLIKPTVQELLVAAGEVLPEDLKQEVAAGAMSQERALELSRERAKSQSLIHGQKHQQQIRQRSEAQGKAEQIHTAAVEWQQGRMKRDPQFEAKLPLLKKEVAWLQSQSRGLEGFDQDGRPTTPEGVKTQLEKAYKAVVLPAAHIAPGGKPVPKVGDGVVKRQPSAGSGASGTARPAQPKSTLDIIKGVVEQRAG